MPVHKNGSFDHKHGLRVEVYNNNIDAAIRMLSRKITQDGMMKEIRARQFYEKPTIKRRRKKAEGRNRWLKSVSQFDR